MDGEDQNCDEQLKIVVRDHEYSVSKKFICSAVPYFEKMFCCDLLEAKENKVELDFDEQVFTSILNWIHTGSFVIQMDYVISLYDAADYLMIDDHLLQPCSTYLHENFTIVHLPVILTQVTKVSKLINSEALENFIFRHFLTIANSSSFYNYSVQTVVSILKLDLMIYSELQIFEFIIKWLKGKDTDVPQLQKLMSCVRWSLLNSKDKKSILDRLKKCISSNSLINFLWFDFELSDTFKTKLNELIEAQSEISSDTSAFDRCKQNFLISIQEKDTEHMLIHIFDNELRCSSVGDFSLDDSMSLEFDNAGQISDILFDSGRKGIRVDWIKKTFRWLDFKVAGKTYYSRLIKFIDEFSDDLSFFGCYLEDKKATTPSSIDHEERILLEHDGTFIVIGKTKDDKKWFGLFPAKHPSWFNSYCDGKRSFQATVQENIVYILTEDLEFIQFNMESRSFNKSEPFKENKFNFNDLILTSHAKNDNRVILVNKTSGKMHIFYTNQAKWVQECRIMNVNFGSSSITADSYKLIAFTSTFLPMKVIKPLYGRNALSK